MVEKFRLPRTKQCAKCPWKVSTNPREIPDGYCELKHKNLAGTIAVPGDVSLDQKRRVMACHHSNGNDDMYCIGWLNHQLGVGNNIQLRLKMLGCENIGEIKTFGKQHETFEDTLPKDKMKN